MPDNRVSPGGPSTVKLRVSCHGQSATEAAGAGWVLAGAGAAWPGAGRPAASTSRVNHSAMGRMLMKVTPMKFLS